MMTTMRPTMRPCSGTSLPAADDPTGVPVSTSPQVGGFIIWRCGAHDDGTGSLGVREPQMNRNTALRLLDSRSSCSRTPAQHTDGRTDWANEPTNSTTPASSFGSTVTSSRRWIRTRRNNAESEGLRVQETPGTPITLSHEGFMTRQQDRRSVVLISLAWPLAPPRISPRGSLGVAALAGHPTVGTVVSMRWLTLVNARWPTEGPRKARLRRPTHEVARSPTAPSARPTPRWRGAPDRVRGR